MMGHRIKIQDAPETLAPEALRNGMDIEGCGSIVSFLGITRGNENGVEVKHLEFDAWMEKLPSVLHNLATQAIDDFGVHSVAMSHRTGVVMPGEDIVCIHVASPHRKEGFAACAWLIDELKAQAPVWKKEVRADGAHWKEGLG
ncbi:MAG TPA: molybdenum cofactor biosynthesis protein MoaE [Candidatus Thalassarchaeaceae archaeon]|nr:molybdenum cofactor biosynthesis protein MoaE [Candidatus Thalassarchaeaceae archaeon]HJM67582.1 molybdenum cofactor biosynthesis protein MoaE [Candidatus Thalassarchaeaceae archaeon]